MLWLIDLDGVVWRYTTLIEGSDDGIALVRSAGDPIRFVTNNSTLTRAQYVEKLAGMGIAAAEEEIITSGMALARCINPGERVLGIGEDGLLDELKAAKCELVVPRSLEDAMQAETVALGWYRKFSYVDMSNACVAIRNGARFLATNQDPTYPLESLIVPGTGALVASVIASTGVTPEYAGKPGAAMVDLVKELAGESTLMIGDRLTTDGTFAKLLGVDFAWVASGIEEEPDASIPVSIKAPNLLEAVRTRLGQGR